MARTSYGKTWWGEQWLNALAHIDHDNRLPRGRSYANKGAVSELRVKGGDIHAKVQGSRATPYRVHIEVPAIEAKKAHGLLDAIAADPARIARLLNRELDPGVLTLADSLGLAVFPARWKDLAMSCSCPDHAVPCKHLAAVIYLLSREIDGDPFLVFSLRGIDLTAGLKARDVLIEHQAAAALPSLAALLVEPPTPGSETPPPDPTALEQLDFSRLPELAEPLLRVLPAAPAFYGGKDFREITRRALASVAKGARRALESAAALDPDAALPAGATGQPRIVLDGELQAEVQGLEQVEDWPSLMQLLAHLPAARLADVQPALAALHHVRSAALQLLARGAVVPQVFSLGGKAVGLRWLPALLDREVQALVRQLAAGLPPGLIVFAPEGEAAPLSGELQASALCSLCLNHGVRRWSEIEPAEDGGDPASALFFADGSARFDGPGEGAVAAGIQAWLARFHLARNEHAPVLCLAETASGDFALTLAVERGGELAPPVPLQQVLSDKAWAATRFAVLQTVSLLAEFFPPLNDYLSDGARSPIALSPQALPALLFDALPLLRLLGIRALLPKALERLLRPRLSMRVSGKAQADGGSFLDANALFQFDWQVAVGDQLLSRSAFEKLVKSATGVVRFKGEYVYLDPAQIAQLRTQLAQPPQLSGPELLRVALAGEYAGAGVGLDAAAKRLLRELGEAGDVAPPAGLQAQLRPYQQRGYAWLYRNARLGLGSVIADDMGLGKTLQVIAALQRLKDDGALQDAKALVVVPTSLLTNWQKELQRFAPGLSVAVFHGAKRELKQARPDVLLTTYGVARSEATALKALAWRLVVVDEAQNIKNPAAAQTKAVKSLPARSFIAMSGTPVENRLSEYWSILDFANRGYLGTLNHFVKDYAVPIQAARDAAVLQRFKRITAPFLMRRMKSDKSIIADLPDKIEQDQYCGLNTDQAALYESVVREGLQVIAGESDTFKRQGLVLQMIMALKQVCNHPAQYLKRGETAAALSGKAERFLELVHDIHAAHDKVLVFTQFREMGELLRGWLAALHGREPLFLHGGVPRARRDAMVEAFQADRTQQVFILSLKAGGTGLNLTAASHVIHYDLWWNPAVEAQATDRAYRIGQQRKVQVHRLITRATFEERINDMIRAKRELAELAVGTGETWIGQLGGDELKALFALG
ncbi:MAG TPA: SNF2-related protein [Ideonella sp.]|nr:SNF2-related protein [Ideonella sp.]